MHSSTNVEKLVKIGLVLVEIFGWISDICRLVQKCSYYPRNLWGYWTDLYKICTRYSYSIAIEYF